MGSTLALLYSKASVLSHTVPGTTGLLNAARDLYQTQVEKLKPGWGTASWHGGSINFLGLLSSTHKGQCWGQECTGYHT